MLDHYSDKTVEINVHSSKSTKELESYTNVDDLVLAKLLYKPTPSKPRREIGQSESCLDCTER